MLSDENETVCGIDSGIFERGGYRSKVFKAPFGVAVTIPEYNAYQDFYEKTLQTVFRYSKKIKKKFAYSSSEIKNVFGNPIESDQFFEKFFVKIASLVKQLDVFYSYFPKDRPPLIKIYGQGGNPVEELSAVRFIENHL